METLVGYDFIKTNIYLAFHLHRLFEFGVSEWGISENVRKQKTSSNGLRPDELNSDIINGQPMYWR